MHSITNIMKFEPFEAHWTGEPNLKMIQRLNIKWFFHLENIDVCQYSIIVLSYNDYTNLTLKGLHTAVVFCYMM